MRQRCTLVELLAVLCLQNALLAVAGFAISRAIGCLSAAEAVGHLVLYALPFWALVWSVAGVVHYVRRINAQRRCGNG